MKNVKVLFIIKERKVYGTKTASYGLVNSCEFVVNALHKCGIRAKVVQVIDNNGIDKEVHEYKPTHCFIEALWVTPSKFEILAKLHPKVKWNVRIHSMIPFLVSEGMSFEWINEYQKLHKEKGINISVSCNNIRLLRDLNVVYNNIEFTPNIYCLGTSKPHNIHVDKSHDILNVGCFGALRILKNHCQEAFWAIEFAQSLHKKLHFHINVSEHETNETSPVLKNLIEIFKYSPHKLILHRWLPHEDFLGLVKKMDLGLQISFTETFNIVAADFVECGIPVVVSNEIDFVHPFSKVNPSEPFDVMVAMYVAYYGKIFNIQKFNNYLLYKHNVMARNAWLKLLKPHGQRPLG